MKLFLTKEEYLFLKEVLLINRETFDKIQNGESPSYDFFHNAIRLFNNDNDIFYLENNKEALCAIQDFFMNYTIYAGFNEEYNLNDKGVISDSLWYKINKLYE